MRRRVAPKKDPVPGLTRVADITPLDDGIYRQADDPRPGDPPLFVIDLLDPRQTGGSQHWLMQHRREQIRKKRREDKKSGLGHIGKALKEAGVDTTIRDEPIGTADAGYSEAGPFRCDHCIHSDAGLCDHPRMAEDPQVQHAADGRAVIKPDGCCTYFRNRNRE